MPCLRQPRGGPGLCERRRRPLGRGRWAGAALRAGVLLMADRFRQVVVRIFTAPEASCGTGMTWAAAVGFVRERLRRRFNGRVAVDHVEIFSQRSFEFPAVLEAIQRGAALPIVQIEGEIVS